MSINPAYYKGEKIECIEVIEQLNLPFHLGAVLKYIWRAGKKGDLLEDLEKAQWFLSRYISNERERRAMSSSATNVERDVCCMEQEKPHARIVALSSPLNGKAVSQPDGYA